ncbi:hypothetical protein [Actinoplanes sp. ATCC 53533]|uniref:hypothetical protein n=1 Tax=Actinoplanes sp. ATCC 53533 TaxID=1288362 RepID=UPI0018F32ECF|nr:hypothetical protein [Actinoplanes sp. ATCC 53533]
MAHYRLLGDVPPKRHTQHRRPDGGAYGRDIGAESFDELACEDPGYAWTWAGRGPS